MSWQSSTNQNWRKRLTMLALAVLISGTNSLFCCGQLMAATAQVETENCATVLGESAGRDDCCSESSSERPQSESDPCTDECCILSAPLAEIPSVAQFDQGLAANAQAAVLSKTTKVASQSVLFSHQVRSIHQQETYLRCCVFLI